MRFTKMHGAGNDYVYVNCFDQPMPERPAELARRISDRHFGVGGDGMILVCPSAVADARMRIFNADGSEAEMCGNGVRCVAKYVYDHGIARKDTLQIETGRGILALQLTIVEDRVCRVRVDMGEPILEPAQIPVQLPPAVTADVGRIGNPPHMAGRIGNPPHRVVDFPAYKFLPTGEPARWIDDCGLDPRMTCVSMGNPHAVFFCLKAALAPLDWLGPYIERQPIFPKRINVHLVQVQSPGEVTMRTWERGSGLTLACGTGACAVCVAGGLTGRTDRQLLAHLPGGDLQLEWAADNHVFMSGEAVEVFSGEWDENREMRD